MSIFENKTLDPPDEFGRAEQKDTDTNVSSCWDPCFFMVMPPANDSGCGGLISMLRKALIYW